MLVIERTHVVFHVIRAKQILRAEFFVGVHMCYSDWVQTLPRPVRPRSFAPQGTASHPFNHGAIGMFLFFSRQPGNHKKEREHGDQRGTVAIHINL